MIKKLCCFGSLSWSLKSRGIPQATVGDSGELCLILHALLGIYGLMSPSTTLSLSESSLRNPHPLCQMSVFPSECFSFP